MPGVLAVALGGSLAGGLSDDESDVDLYVYADDPPPVAMRLGLIGDGRGVEIDNRFWETGDEWEDAGSGIAVDVTYRSPRWAEDQLDRVLVQHQASTGYTTAVWHNVRMSRVLADPHRWYEVLQTRANGDYPEELRRAIVAKNQPILRAARGAYRRQIAKALARNDHVSVNHRVTALLESVFDILFAVNRQTHPGEKRLLTHAQAVCPLRPPGFEDKVEMILTAKAGDPGILLESIDALVAAIEDMLRAEKLLGAGDVALHDLATP